MVRTMRAVTAAAFVVVLGAAGGCSSLDRTPPTRTDLAPAVIGARIVVMPPKVSLPGSLHRLPDADEQIRYVAVQTRASLEKAFAEVGYRIIPYDRVETMLLSGTQERLEEGSEAWRGLLRTAVGAHYVALPSVTVEAGRDGRASEIVRLRIIELTENAPERVFRWRRSPEERAVAREEKPASGSAP